MAKYIDFEQKHSVAIARIDLINRHMGKVAVIL